MSHLIADMGGEFGGELGEFVDARDIRSSLAEWTF